MAQVAITYMRLGLPAGPATEVARQMTAKSADVPLLMELGKFSAPTATEIAARITAGNTQPSNAAERLMGVGVPATLAKAMITGITAEYA